MHARNELAQVSRQHLTIPSAKTSKQGRHLGGIRDGSKEDRLPGGEQAEAVEELEDLDQQRTSTIFLLSGTFWGLYTQYQFF